MKFITTFPATLISHRGINGRLHYFGTTDMNGILEVPDDDKYIGYLKAKFTPTENDIPLKGETIGADIKSSTTPITGDKGDIHVNNGKASSNAGVKSKRTHSTGSNAHSNGKNVGRRGSKSAKRC